MVNSRVSSASEHDALAAVRAGLSINLPPPSGPSVDPEKGAGDEVEAVVVIPDGRDNAEAGQFAPEPDALVVGGRIEINVVPGIARRAANRPIARGEQAPPGPHVGPRQHPALRFQAKWSRSQIRWRIVSQPAYNVRFYGRYRLLARCYGHSEATLRRPSGYLVANR